MTTRSDQDINASTAIHIGKTTRGYSSGTGEGELQMLESEREEQLTDLQFREGRTIPGASYPISPSQDEVGALAFEPTGIPPRSTAPNPQNRGLSGPTQQGMGGSKPADKNTPSAMQNARERLGTNSGKNTTRGLPRGPAKAK